jgi:hypothetical protein
MAKKLDWSKADIYEEDPALFQKSTDKILRHGVRYCGPKVTRVVHRKIKTSGTPEKTINTKEKTGSQLLHFVEKRSGVEMLIDFKEHGLFRVFVSRHKLVKVGLPIVWLKAAYDLCLVGETGGEIKFWVRSEQTPTRYLLTGKKRAV